MATPITMPQLGESVTEGTVGRWLKREGDRIEKYEPVVEVITDKVNAEIPAPVAGVLQRIVVPEGQTVAVGQEIAVVEEVAAEAPAPTEAVSPASARQQPDGQRHVGATAERVPAPAGEEEAAAERKRYSPVVRRLSQEYHLDLERVPGTGLGGRVTKEDVLAFVAAQGGGVLPSYLQPRPAEPAAAAPSVPPPTEARPEVVRPTVPAAERALADEEYLPLTPMRRQIAEHLSRAKREAPHAWTMVEVDVTNLVRWREQVKEEFARREGVELTYLPFVIKAAVEALKEFPRLNAQWGGDHIVVKKRVNVGVAVALEDGLVVPVVHNADGLSIAGLAKALHDLARRARAGQLTLQDVQGGTFTVNNTGAFGSIMSQPIVNYPQAAILTTELIQKRPVVLENDAIAIRSMMNMCLSFDHRICDGLTVGRFLQAVKRRLESATPAPTY